MTHRVMGEKTFERPICKTCVYWNRATKDTWTDFDGQKSYEVEHAQCRRHAPSRMATNERALAERAWPHVNANDWCGDHRPHVGSAPP